MEMNFFAPLKKKEKEERNRKAEEEAESTLRQDGGNFLHGIGRKILSKPWTIEHALSAVVKIKSTGFAATADFEMMALLQKFLDLWPFIHAAIRQTNTDKILQVTEVSKKMFVNIFFRIIDGIICYYRVSDCCE